MLVRRPVKRLSEHREYSMSTRRSDQHRFLGQLVIVLIDLVSPLSPGTTYGSGQLKAFRSLVGLLTLLMKKVTMNPILVPAMSPTACWKTAHLTYRLFPQGGRSHGYRDCLLASCRDTEKPFVLAQAVGNRVARRSSSR